MPRENSGKSSKSSQSKLTSSGGPALEAASASRQDELTRDALYAEAARLGINGRSRMRKETLLDAIARKKGEQTADPENASNERGARNYASLAKHQSGTRT